MSDSDQNLPSHQNHLDDTAAMPADSETAVGHSPKTDEVLDDFRLLRRLGKGGMAEVWLAEQQSLKRNVALKLLRPDLTEDEVYVARFQTEAKAAAGLNHPNIVQVYTVGERNGQYFIAQEYVEGATLKSFIQKKGPLEIKLALRIMRQVASALKSAAEKGIVHRDIKPENIMLTRKGEAKVADFGLAQLQGGERLNLTQEGVTMGTPLYMSPEQVSGKKLDQRSDIYSFGVTCYYMLVGRPPFEGENAVSVAVKHLHEKPEPIQNIRADLPVSICRVIARMTAKNPDERYDTAEEILNDVRKIAKALETGEPIDHLFDESVGAAKSFPVKRPLFVLSMLSLIIALSSAGIGWALKRDLPESVGSSLPEQDTIREQFEYAMLEVDNEDAFLAVIDFEDPSTSAAYYRIRAHEELALMYLRDPYRRKAALNELGFLENLTSEDLKVQEEAKAKARIGRAYLDALDGNIGNAKVTLTKLSGNIENLSPSWQQLEAYARERTDETKSQGST